MRTSRCACCAAAPSGRRFPAKIAGAGERVGSLEKGKIANVIVTDGDLFDEKTKLRYVFVDGRWVNFEEPPAEGRRAGGRSGS